MMFNFDSTEALTFFAVLIRYSVMFAVLPFFGDQLIPGIIKVLFSFALSVVMYPVLISTGMIDPASSLVWSASVSGIAKVVCQEALFGIALGFSGKLVFDAIRIGADIAGNFMGFSSAATFDPNQQSQTQVVSKLQMTLAMLLFVAVDGHYVLLKAALHSYRVVGIGEAQIAGAFTERLVNLSSEVIRLGMQLGAPMAASIFGINLVYAVMAKAMPQLNVLILSFSVSALVGLFVMLISMPAFTTLTGNIFDGLGDSLMESAAALRK